MVTCSFRFETRPDDEIVELVANHNSARVCQQCLTLLTVHRRIHRMRIEQVIAQMARLEPLVTEV